MASEKKSDRNAKASAKTAAKAGAKTAAAKKAAAPARAPKGATIVARGPVAKLKALHGSKEDLAKKLAAPLAMADEDTEALTERLSRASNAQLLRLAKVVDAVKSKYGSRDKLIQSLGKLVNKAKDQDYLAKLGTFSLPKLFDLARTHERRARA
jgi:hypothetical protein